MTLLTVMRGFQNKKRNYNPFGETCGAIAYLNRTDVQASLHVQKTTFNVCNMSVNEE